VRRGRSGGIGWENPFARSHETISSDRPLIDILEGSQEDDALSRLLDRIEADALAVYAAHGLPVEAGDYVRQAGASDWRRIGGTLTPEQRWSWIENHPQKDGWRFARLHDLGRHHDDRDLKAAARLLDDIALLRNVTSSGTISERLGRAITLGATWQALGSSTGEPALPPRLVERRASD